MIHTGVCHGTLGEAAQGPVMQDGKPAHRAHLAAAETLQPRAFHQRSRRQRGRRSRGQDEVPSCDRAVLAAPWRSIARWPLVVRVRPAHRQGHGQLHRGHRGDDPLPGQPLPAPYAGGIDHRDPARDRALGQRVPRPLRPLPERPSGGGPRLRRPAALRGLLRGRGRLHRHRGDGASAAAALPDPSAGLRAQPGPRDHGLQCLGRPRHRALRHQQRDAFPGGEPQAQLRRAAARAATLRRRRHFVAHTGTLVGYLFAGKPDPMQLGELSSFFHGLGLACQFAQTGF